MQVFLSLCADAWARRHHFSTIRAVVRARLARLENQLRPADAALAEETINQVRRRLPDAQRANSALFSGAYGSRALARASARRVAAGAS
jgi:hypothetical protein